MPKFELFLYDSGDSWDHVIKLEKWFENTTTEGLPFLLEAAGRCPPEDVGGAPGYAEYLAAISDPPTPSTNICASEARSGSIPTSSIRRRSKPRSTRCPTQGNRDDAPREQNRRQAPFKRAAELRLPSTPNAAPASPTALANANSVSPVPHQFCRSYGVSTVKLGHDVTLFGYLAFFGRALNQAAGISAGDARRLALGNTTLVIEQLLNGTGKLIDLKGLPKNPY